MWQTEVDVQQGHQNTNRHSRISPCRRREGLINTEMVKWTLNKSWQVKGKHEEIG